MKLTNRFGALRVFWNATSHKVIELVQSALGSSRREFSKLGLSIVA